MNDITAALRGEEKEAKEVKCPGPDGTLKWWKWWVRPWQKGLENEVGAMLCLEDVTALKRDKELLLAAERVSRTGGWELDLAKNEVYWSPMTKKIHEVPERYRPNLEEGINFYKEGQHREKIRELVGAAIAKGTPWDQELIIITAKGREVWVRAKGEAEMHQDKCVRIFGTFQDINAKKKDELERQHIAQRIQTATKAANIGIWELDVKTQKLVWVRNMPALSGGKNKIPGLNDVWGKHVFAEDRKVNEQRFKKALKDKSDFSSEFRVALPDKKIRTLKTKGKTLYDDLGYATKMIGATWDITDIRTTRQKLQQSQETFFESFKNAVIGMAIVGPDKKWLKVNASLCHILGYSEEELLTMHIDETTYQDDLQLTQKTIDGAIAGALENYQIEKRYVHKNGGTVHAIVTVTVVRNAQGNLSHFIVQILDLTPRILAENQLNDLLEVSKHQNESLLNFAHIVSHNLRSHTSNLSMLHKFLVEEEDEQEKIQLLQLLQNATESLTETVHHLNEVVKVKTKVADEMENVPLLATLKRIQDSIGSIIIENRVETLLEVSPEISVRAVPAYLESILLNLFTNAIKYQAPQRRPKVWVSARTVRDLVHISFEDNGLGIDLERHGKHLFKMYKTFHKNKDAKGIGLFITKNQVEAMQGSINVESAPNVGSTFTITLKKAL
ncbi:PAS domain S-box protein [Maribacter sp. 2307ULW6-5]|uniref:PAS domain-containing sensor histidine kinase n=1 Tax=Maribacter sp. 2307ULW6-5 TaxID=3386275 RepID=UPI0039BC81BA